MAEIETTTVLRLTEQEVIALKKLLGKFSRNDHEGYGLSENESELVSGVWDLLPYLECEEE